MSSAPPHAVLTLDDRHGKAALLALVIASGTAFLDSSVVTVALPAIQRDLGGGLSTMQWVVDAYLLTLGAFLLVGGALGDLLGKRRVFLAGLVSFGVASALCAVAPTDAALVAARAVQGVAAAMLVPGSLSLITAGFDERQRPRAIGLWGGLSGLFTLLGPFVGGVLVDTAPAGWRWVFLLNLPLLALSWVLTLRYVPAMPGSRHAAGTALSQVDLVGGVLAATGLGLVTGALIEAGRLGPGPTVTLVAVGAAVLAGFVMWERRCETRWRSGGATRQPMLPPSLFAVRTFTLANVVTFVVYGSIGGMTTFLTWQLIVTLGWSALAAGATSVPITLTLALFSGRVGSLVPRFGAKRFLVVGPALMAAGQLLLAGVGPGDTYVAAVLPGSLVFAAGLVLIVAPVTATALGAVQPARAGTASGVNNAVARVAQLLAVAALPVVAGMTAAENGSGDVAGLAAGYPRAIGVTAVLCLLGSAVALALPADTGRTDAA